MFQTFLKDWNDVQGDELFQILGALNENTMPTNEFGGMNVCKLILLDDRRAQLDLEYNCDRYKII